MKKIESVYYWNCRRLEALYGAVDDAAIIAETAAKAAVENK